MTVRRILTTTNYAMQVPRVVIVVSVTVTIDVPLSITQLSYHGPSLQLECHFVTGDNILSHSFTHFATHK